jgi:CBS domain-containing protein
VIHSKKEVKELKISEVMTRDVEFINESDTVAQAARKMKELNVGIMPVFNNNQLVGLLTDRDIAIRSAAEGHNPESTKVGEIMTKDVVACHEDEDVNEALKIMEHKQIRRLIVRDEQNQVVGILSLGDLAVSMSEASVGGTLREVSEPAKPER